jgi:GAF domain-containing protein
MARQQLQSGEADLAAVLSDVARTLESDSGVDSILDAITASSVATVPGASYAGILLVRDKREVESLAPTDHVAVEADKAQEECGEGPCLDAIWEHDTFLVDDYKSEGRWPAFGARALGLGIRSSLSFQLFTDSKTLGALNLYSPEPHAFNDESRQIGLPFAAHAAVALRGAQRENDLQTALRSRDVIGMAKGILIERYKVPEGRAFEMLVRTSQDSHVKLHDVAEFLVHSGVESPRRS